MDDSQSEAAQHIDTGQGTCERCQGSGIWWAYDTQAVISICTCITDRLAKLERQAAQPTSETMISGSVSAPPEMYSSKPLRRPDTLSPELRGRIRELLGGAVPIRQDTSELSWYEKWYVKATSIFRELLND